MSTHSRIGIENPNGTITAVYCHFDGFVANNGTILRDHYFNVTKINELIEMGNLSSLGVNLNDSEFYGRDYDDPASSTRAITFENRDHYCNEYSNGIEYAYVWNGIEWLVSEDGAEFVRINEALTNSKEDTE